MYADVFIIHWGIDHVAV